MPRKMTEAIPATDRIGEERMAGTEEEFIAMRVEIDNVIEDGE